jgi:hypothetical protein
MAVKAIRRDCSAPAAPRQGTIARASRRGLLAAGAAEARPEAEACTASRTAALWWSSSASIAAENTALGAARVSADQVGAHDRA